MHAYISLVALCATLFPLRLIYVPGSLVPPPSLTFFFAYRMSLLVIKVLKKKTSYERDKEVGHHHRYCVLYATGEGGFMLGNTVEKALHCKSCNRAVLGGGGSAG